MRRIVLLCSLMIALVVPTVAAAHPHTIETPDHTQPIANRQNHADPVNGVMCGGDPAAYGLETAHHGPDAGTSGNADGCYQTTGNVHPRDDVENPVIR